jgi:hypothetical protein
MAIFPSSVSPSLSSPSSSECVIYFILGSGRFVPALGQTAQYLNVAVLIIIIIIIIISCHRFSFFPGTSPLETVVIPTTQASSLSL